MDWQYPNHDEVSRWVVFGMSNLTNKEWEIKINSCLKMVVVVLLKARLGSESPISP